MGLEEDDCEGGEEEEEEPLVREGCAAEREGEWIAEVDKLQNCSSSMVHDSLEVF